MAEVEVRRDSLLTETTTKKTRKVKKTKRRESADQGSEITITEVDQTTTEQTVDQDEEGYVNERKSSRFVYSHYLYQYTWYQPWF